MERISVIVPVYNTEKYLSRCLESIVNNNYRELEIVCINDGSSDNSLAILKEYQKQDSRIIVLDTPNSGVSAARNMGLDYATGDYIAFVDSDDWVHKEYFRILLHYQKKYESDITMCNYIKTIDYIDDVPFQLQEDKAMDVESLIKNQDCKTYVWGRLYKRSYIATCRFEKDISLSEDKIFNIDCFCQWDRTKIILIDYDMYYYYGRNDSAIKTICDYENIKISDLLLKRIKSNRDIDYVCLTEALKNALSTRYGTKYSTTNEQKNRINNTLRLCIKLQRDYKIMEPKESFVYRAFVYFPFLYRMFRIIDDPSMLKWEKQMKKT